MKKQIRNIRAAQLLFDNELYDESANRAYYAAFQAALAALSTFGLHIEKISHEATQSVFNRELIYRRKIFPGKLKEKFPEIDLVEISESPENPNHIWVNIILPEDEDREIALSEKASKISTDILMKYGYLIMISTAVREEKSAA